MKLSNSLIVFLAASATAKPTPVVKRADLCDQRASVKTGSFTVYNNLWGEKSATSGSQCFGVNGLSGNAVSWHTTWSWAGAPLAVKSYANAVISSQSKPLSQISSMQSAWSWTYAGINVVADVSYDMFTSASAGGATEYEIMIWVAALEAQDPFQVSFYGSDGKAVPIKSLTLNGTTWKLYKGPNGNTTVFSFIADSPIAHFSGDVKAFLSYLITNEGLPNTQYLTSIGAGTEPFTGSNAVFTVSSYSISIT